jgi:hypothetical protein
VSGVSRWPGPEVLLSLLPKQSDIIVVIQK